MSADSVPECNRQTSGESASLPQYLGCNTVFDMRLRVTFLRQKTVSLQSNIAHWYESVKKCYLSKSTSTLLIHTISYRCHEKNCCRAGRGPIIATFYFPPDYVPKINKFTKGPWYVHVEKN
jgi:hypothetical protein